MHLKGKCPALRDRFSFADEHIATITKRAADNNPTLQIVIFAYNDVEEANYRKYLWIDSACINNNIKIITPSSLGQQIWRMNISV